jgi:hypothetical protein
MKRTLLAIGAAAVLAATAVPTSASAQHRHWGGGHFRGPGISFGLGVVPGPYYGYNDYAYTDDCYRFRRVRTPYGWETRRVWVC